MVKKQTTWSQGLGGGLAPALPTPARREESGGNPQEDLRRKRSVNNSIGGSPPEQNAEHRFRSQFERHRSLDEDGNYEENGGVVLESSAEEDSHSKSNAPEGLGGGDTSTSRSPEQASPMARAADPPTAKHLDPDHRHDPPGLLHRSQHAIGTSTRYLDTGVGEASAKNTKSKADNTDKATGESSEGSASADIISSFHLSVGTSDFTDFVDNTGNKKEKERKRREHREKSERIRKEAAEMRKKVDAMMIVDEGGENDDAHDHPKHDKKHEQPHSRRSNESDDPSRTSSQNRRRSNDSGNTTKRTDEALALMTSGTSLGVDLKVSRELLLSRRDKLAARVNHTGESSRAILAANGNTGAAGSTGPPIGELVIGSGEGEIGKAVPAVIGDRSNPDHNDSQRQLGTGSNRLLQALNAGYDEQGPSSPVSPPPQRRPNNLSSSKPQAPPAPQAAPAAAPAAPRGILKTGNVDVPRADEWIQQQQQLLEQQIQQERMERDTRRDRERERDRDRDRKERERRDRDRERYLREQEYKEREMLHHHEQLRRSSAEGGRDRSSRVRDHDREREQEYRERSERETHHRRSSLNRSSGYDYERQQKELERSEKEWGYREKELREMERKERKYREREVRERERQKSEGGVKKSTSKSSLAKELASVSLAPADLTNTKKKSKHSTNSFDVLSAEQDNPVIMRRKSGGALSQAAASVHSFDARLADRGENVEGSRPRRRGSASKFDAAGVARSNESADRNDEAGKSRRLKELESKLKELEREKHRLEQKNLEKARRKSGSALDPSYVLDESQSRSQKKMSRRKSGSALDSRMYEDSHGSDPTLSFNRESIEDLRVQQQHKQRRSSLTHAPAATARRRSSIQGSASGTMQDSRRRGSIGVPISNVPANFSVDGSSRRSSTSGATATTDDRAAREHKREKVRRRSKSSDMLTSFPDTSFEGSDRQRLSRPKDRDSADIEAAQRIKEARSKQKQRNSGSHLISDRAETASTSRKSSASGIGHNSELDMYLHRDLQKNNKLAAASIAASSRSNATTGHKSRSHRRTGSTERADAERRRSSNESKPISKVERRSSLSGVPNGRSMQMETTGERRSSNPSAQNQLNPTTAPNTQDINIAGAVAEAIKAETSRRNSLEEEVRVGRHPARRRSAEEEKGSKQSSQQVHSAQHQMMTRRSSIDNSSLAKVARSSGSIGAIERNSLPKIEKAGTNQGGTTAILKSAGVKLESTELDYLYLDGSKKKSNNALTALTKRFGKPNKEPDRVPSIFDR